jgi:hypothetical protein
MLAYFRPHKIAWETVLEKWKKTNCCAVHKIEFSKFLKEAFEIVGVNLPSSVISGLKACGVMLFDP